MVILNLVKLMMNINYFIYMKVVIWEIEINEVNMFKMYKMYE